MMQPEPDDPTARQEADDLSALADELLDQAARMRRQWNQLAEAVGIEGAAPSGAPPNGVPTGEEADRMRLVALDMVLSGAGRDEVAEHLHRTFDSEDVDRVVDAVFAEYGS
jgi:hypothetical protein